MKIIVSGLAAGSVKKGATGDSFFFFFCNFFFFFHFCNFFSPKLDNIFLPNKMILKKKIAAALLARITATRWTGNRLFLWTA